MSAEILNSDSPEAKAILRDFRVWKNGKAAIAKLSGEGKIPGILGSDNLQKRKLHVEYLELSDWQKLLPPVTFRWIRALRLRYLMITLFPALICLAASFRNLNSTMLVQYVMATICIFLIQISAHLWNDFEDHMRGIDNPANGGGSGVIANLWIPAIQIRQMAIAFLLIAFCIGAGILFTLDKQSLLILALLGCLGGLGASSYSGWPWHIKYIGYGEILVLMLCGPLLMTSLGVIVSADKAYLPWYFFLGIPSGILAFVRFHVGNMQKIPFDLLAKSKTIAIRFSFSGAKKIALWGILGSYLAVFGLVFLKIIPWVSILVLVCFPLLNASRLLLNKIKSPIDPEFAYLKDSLDWHAFYFSLMLGASLALAN